MKRLFILLVLVPLVLVTACGTLFVAGGADYRAGERAFKEGKYDVALEKALSALETNPEFPEAAELLQRTAEQGPRNILAEIDTLQSSGRAFASDSIWREYAHLERIHRILSGSSYASRYPTKSYAQERDEAKETAAEEYYQAGSRALARGDFRSAREASRYLASAQALIADYKDTQSLLAQAKEAGIARVMVYSVQGMDILERAAINALGGNPTVREFTQFVSPAALGIGQGRSLANVVRDSQEADVDLLLYIESVTAGRVTDTRSRPNISLAGGLLSGNEYTWGYNQEIEGTLQLIDVAAGQVLSQQSYRDSASDSITATIITGTSSMRLNLRDFGDGSFAVMRVQDATSLLYGVYDDFHASARDFVSRQNYDAVRAADSFEALKRIVHNEIWYYGTEILTDDATELYYPLYDKVRTENTRRYEYSNSLFNTTKTKAPLLAREASQDFSALEQSAGSAIGAAMIKHIQ